MGYLKNFNKNLFPLLQASICLGTNKIFEESRIIAEPKHFFTTAKVEKFVEESFNKTTQAATETKETNQQEYIDELNKNNIYLLVTTKTTKQQEKILLLLEPEDRFNPEKLLVEQRHKIMMAKALDNPEPQEDSKKAKEKSKILASQLQDKIKDNDKLEKTLNFIERGKEIRKKKSLYLYKDVDRTNPLGKVGTNLALRTPFLEINAKTGQLKNKDQRFMSGQIRPIKLYSQLKNFKLNKRASSELKFLRDNQSYYGANRSSLKSICPVFFDKKSAEDFLIQNSNLSVSQLEHKRNLLKIYNKLLKSEEFFTKKVLEKIKNSKENIQEDTNSLGLFNKLNKNIFSRLENRNLDSSINLDEHKNILPTIRRTLYLYRKEINSLILSKENKRPSTNNLEKGQNEINNTKVISLGLGDFIKYYSSVPKNKSLERIEFLFFPKVIETKDGSPVKNLFTKGRKTEETNNFILNFELKGKTFKDYQKEYFNKKSF